MRLRSRVGVIDNKVALAWRGSRVRDEEKQRDTRVVRRPSCYGFMQVLDIGCAVDKLVVPSSAVEGSLLLRERLAGRCALEYGVEGFR